MNANNEDEEESNEVESSDETEDDDEEEQEGAKIDDSHDKEADEEIAEEDAPNDGHFQSLREPNASDGGNYEPGTTIALVDASPDMQKTLERSPSPSLDGISKSVEALSVSDIKVKVTSDLSKARSHQQRKYHSKRSTRQIGRPKGSKAKQDKTIKLDHDGIWD
jgi:RIO kinase 2